MPPFPWLKREMRLEELMFDINFIEDPGIQEENSEATWGYIQKREEETHNTTKKSKNTKTEAPGKKRLIIGITAVLILAFCSFVFFKNKPSTVSPDMVLNQVIDLIVESGYMQNLQLAEAQFEADMVSVTIRSDELLTLQNFTQRYRKEDKIPYEMFRKNDLSYVKLMFPWDGRKVGGDIQTLKTLAGKTVFSNKISINFTENEFELQGRSSDIISYLLQMAENDLIQKFTFFVRPLESGRFYLKVLVNRV